MNLISLVMAMITAATVSIVVAYWPAKASVLMVYVSDVESCFQRELDRCPDVLCEMSTDDNSVIIQQVRDNVIDCLERKRK